jgi:tetratricopeptide (TPR) repeat protein
MSWRTLSLRLGLVLALVIGRLPTPATAQSSLFQPQPERQQLAREYFQYGVEHARNGLLQDAIGHFKYSIGLDADYIDAYFMLGLVYYHLGLSHLRETDYAMTKVLELQPMYPDALVYRGLTRMRLGAFAAAERDFQSLLAIAPETLPVRRDLASAYLRQGKIDAAIEQYKSCHRTNP